MYSIPPIQFCSSKSTKSYWNKLSETVLLQVKIDQIEIGFIVSQPFFNLPHFICIFKESKLEQCFPTFFLFAAPGPYLVLQIFGNTPNWFNMYKDQGIVTIGGIPVTSSRHHLRFLRIGNHWARQTHPWRKRTEEGSKQSNEHLICWLTRSKFALGPLINDVMP